MGHTYIGADSIVINPVWAERIVGELAKWRAGGLKPGYHPSKLLMAVSFSSDGNYQFIEGVRFDRNVFREAHYRPHPMAVLIPSKYSPNFQDILSTNRRGIETDGFIAGQVVNIKFGASAHIDGREDSASDVSSYTVVPVRFVHLNKAARMRVLKEKGLPDFLFGGK